MDLEPIRNKIYDIRGFKVILDFDLSYMYGVETAQLKRSVRRNIERFEGDDFMFELTKEEFENLRCQIGISSWGGSRYLPFAFTEMGISMLSSVLNSKTAIATNRKIMRTFVALRHYADGLIEINHKIEKLSDRADNTDVKVEEVFNMLTELLDHKRELEKPIRKVGFITNANREEHEEFERQNK